MEYAQNSFGGGLVLDMNADTVKDDTLTDALNATCVTFNGNETALQNDMGNARITYREKNGSTGYAQLSEGMIPLCAKDFGRIMYVVSVSKDGVGEIGSFPSPDYSTSTGDLVNKYQPLMVGIDMAGEVCPLRTSGFNFDLQHPVEMNVETSYDGSVNLILTDNKNKPRIINTGFAVRENDTYIITERFGENNTNRYPVYNDIKFDISTSLYNDTNEIVNFEYVGQEQTGQLQVGNYVFYAIACDKDGNESDIIAESGTVPVFIGTDNDPFSINGGSENMRSDKAVILRLTNTENIKYVKICYTRASSANNESSITSAYKINETFQVDDGTRLITITGFEGTTQITVDDINVQYFNADKVKSQAIVQNILFQANLTEENQADKEFEALREYSLTIVPSVVVDQKVDIGSDYKYPDGCSNSYYNSKFVYDFTGYHPGEIYRFGIVYIRDDNSFTSVFDVLGVNSLEKDQKAPANISINSNDISQQKPYCTSMGDCSENMLGHPYNTKGVCRINDNVINNIMDVVGIRFTFTSDDMPNRENYKGFFFVRQKRIPTLLASGYVTNICEQSFLPSINVEYEYDQTISGHTIKKKGMLHNYESFCTAGFKYYDASWKGEYPDFYPQKPNGYALLSNSYKTRLFSLTDKALAFFDRSDSEGDKAVSVLYQQELNQDKDMMSSVIYDEWPEKNISLYNHQFQNAAGKQFCMLSINGQSTSGKDEYRLGAVFLAQVDIDESAYKNNIVNLYNKDNSSLCLNNPKSDRPPYPSNKNMYFYWCSEAYAKGGSLNKNNYGDFYDSKSTIKGNGLKDSSGNKYEWYYPFAQCIASDVILEGGLTSIQVSYNKSQKKITVMDTQKFDGLAQKTLCVIDCKDTPMCYGVDNTWTYGDSDSYDKYKVIGVGTDGIPKSQLQSENLEFVETVHSDYDVSQEDTGSYKDGDFVYKTSSKNQLDVVISQVGSTIQIVVYGRKDDRYYNVDSQVSLYSSNVAIALKDKEMPSYSFYFTGNYQTDAIPSTPYKNMKVKIDGVWYQFQDYILSGDSIYGRGDAKDSAFYRIQSKAISNDAISNDYFCDDQDQQGYEFDISTYNGKFGYPSKKESASYGGTAYYYNPMEYNSYAMYCPDFELDMPYYNNIFTGQELVIKSITTSRGLTEDSLRLYKYDDTDISAGDIIKSYALSIEEGMSLGTILHKKQLRNPRSIRRDENVFFSAKAGDMTTKTFAFAGAEFLAQTNPTTVYNTKEKYGRLAMQYPFNVLRGLYGSYVGLYPYVETSKGKYTGVDIANKLVNVYIPNYSLDNIEGYFRVRFEDTRQYYRISDSFSFGEQNSVECYRGDCFIGWYTHRLNRNFNDSAAPYNDTILQGSCFKAGLEKLFSLDYRNFDLTKNPDVATNINLGDLNAVQLGSWITFPCRSSRNISIRSTNESWTDEKAQSGNARSFYPLHSIDPSGSYKLKESDNYNEGFSKSGGDRYHFNQNNYIWQNNYYKNRIQYSNVMVNGQFQNGNRVFLSSHYRDYSDQYGSITKIVPISGNLLVVCEHGILLVPVNERALAGEGQGGYVYINTSNVLPETPKEISDSYGSTWPESIVSTPYGVYGIDSRSKKIWFTDGNTLKCLSDFSIQSFLNKAFPMDGQSPDIGKVNIKSHLNMFKGDVMFTAYSDDAMWNLCFSQHFGKWQTFYTWIPSVSANIGNCMITFDHQADRRILGLDTSSIHYGDDINYFWKHGQSDSVRTDEEIKPAFWYGTQHPFEFEFVVRKDASVHKIFENLKIFGNKAEPESFHYQVVGECYDLGNDKPNMYYRQELTKALYNICLKSKVKYNPDFLDITPKKSLNIGSSISKSTMFPLYYRRIDNVNDIESYYQQMKQSGYDYQGLSGSEIIRDKLLDEYRIQCHVKGVDMRRYGRIHGNMHYKEDCWYVQIPSITYMQENEYADRPFVGRPIINLGNAPIPDDATIHDFDLDLLNEQLGLHYQADDISFKKWGDRKEMRLKDKAMRVRIRYTGNDLAIVQGILTTFNISKS